MKPDLRRRLERLEEGAAPDFLRRVDQAKSPRDVSLPDLCRYVAHFTTPEQLKADSTDEDFRGLVEMIRQYEPGYGAGYVA